MINGYGNKIAWTVRIPELRIDIQSESSQFINNFMRKTQHLNATIQLWESIDGDRPTCIFTQEA